MRSWLLSFVGVAVAEQYCPLKGDLEVAYCGDGLDPSSCPTLQDGGWKIHGGGGAATKTAFDLNGGYVEFDFDVSGVESQVNANIYTISPQFHKNSFNKSLDYCDGAASGSQWCTEMDWIESNGACGGATTIHTIEGGGGDGCTSWGCRVEYHYNGKSKFHMRVEYDDNSQWTVIRDGQQLSGYSPQPDDSTWSVVKAAYEQRGAVIYSSQWTGWVPVGDCSQGGGSLSDSKFEISNLVISGKVVQGPKPHLCGATTTEVPQTSTSLVPPPSPTSTPSPSTSPSPSDCPGGSLENCIDLCPADIYQVCVESCAKRCPQTVV